MRGLLAGALTQHWHVNFVRIRQAQRSRAHHTTRRPVNLGKGFTKAQAAITFPVGPGSWPVATAYLIPWFSDGGPWTSELIQAGEPVQSSRLLLARRPPLPVQLAAAGPVASRPRDIFMRLVGLPVSLSTSFPCRKEVRPSVWNDFH